MVKAWRLLESATHEAPDPAHTRKCMSPSPTPSPSSRVAPIAWLILIAAVVAGALWWWRIGRPVALPGAPSALSACVSCASFLKPGETPVEPHAFDSRERIDADLKFLSERFDCVRN